MNCAENVTGSMDSHIIDDIDPYESENMSFFVAID